MFSFLQMSPERLNLAPEGAAHLKAGLFHGICHLGTTGMGWKERKSEFLPRSCSGTELSHLDGADSAGSAVP